MKSKAPIIKTKIAVISDTHIPKQADKLPEELLEELTKSAFIIHAGDFEDINTLKELQKLNRVIGVVGNMDSKEIKNIIDKDMKDVQKFGIQGTPTFFINGKMVFGGDGDKIRQYIEEEIK